MPNICVVVMTYGLLQWQVEGHLLLSGGHGRDLTARDFKHIVDYLSCMVPGEEGYWAFPTLGSLIETQEEGQKDTPTGPEGGALKVLSEVELQAVSEERIEPEESASMERIKKPIDPPEPEQPVLVSQPPAPTYLRGRLQGVRINCRGERGAANLSPYTSISIPKCHRDVQAAKASAWKLSELSLKVGLPIRWFGPAEDPVWSGKENALDNPEAARFLVFESLRKLGLGNIVLFRDDEKDLRPVDVEALCKFAESEENNIVATQYPGSFPPAWLKPNFRRFFEKFVRDKGPTRKWDDHTSPFDL